MKNKILFYSLCIIFSIIAIFLLIVSKGRDEILASIALLLMSGVGGVCVYMLERKEDKHIEPEKTITITDKRSKTIALMIGCLSFVIVGYLFLPFNHLFDNIRRYTPIMGWSVGIAGILFFGFGFVMSITSLIKPKIILQLSDEGILIPEGFRNQKLIAWKDIKEVAKNDTFLFIYLKNPKLYTVNKVSDFISTGMTGTNINIPLSVIDYNIEQVENFIKNKLTLHQFV